MKKKIFRSVIAVAVTVLLISLITVTGFVYNYFNNVQTNQLKSELNRVASAIGTAEDCEAELDASLFRFTLIDGDGTVLYDNRADISEMDNHLDREEIREALSSGKGSSVRYSSTLTQKTVYEAAKLPDGKVLRVSVSQTTAAALVFSMLPYIVAVILLSILISFILAVRMAKKSPSPSTLLI